MPRRRRPTAEGLALWLSGLPPWKRRVLEVLAGSERPLTTGEILEAIDYEARLSTLYNWLRRLESKGLLQSVKVFMRNKRAWKLRADAREVVEGLLRAGAQRAPRRE
ncbi:MAG: hypothetical protein GSR80_000840 [Desulfurococcales archaeon]|nr:hypothetical protein [Desulfurococcales archaeon]